MNRWEENLLKIIKIEFPNVDLQHADRCFLLPDGTFLSTKKGNYEEDRYDPHYTIDNWMGNCVFDFTHHSYQKWRWDDDETKREKMQKYGLTEEEFEEMYENIDWERCGAEYGSPILQHLGCIRLNGEKEFFAVIPNRFDDYIPTQTQFSRLHDWLYEFCDPLLRDRDKGFEVDVNDDYESARYDTNNWTEIDPKYIYYKILKYYRSGRLEEKLDKFN